MPKNIPDTLKNKKDRDAMYEEFCVPVFENLKFLMDDYGFKEPLLKLESRESSVTYKKHRAEIEIAYEPFSLPSGLVTRPIKGLAQRVLLNQLMDDYGFRSNALKYRQFNEARKKLRAIDSPAEADEFARSSNEVFAQAVAERVKDIASMFKGHFRDIFPE